MAIVDKSRLKTPNVFDQDESVALGLKLPMTFDNGYDASTKTTLEAVKQNVLNLCSTEIGERVMQPNLGVSIKKYLFEPFSEDLVVQVQDTIVESMNFWLPFVQLNDIRVKMSDNNSDVGRSTMEISVDFSLKQDPTSTESVTMTVGGE
jgi:phage baseplate assembly protein W